jgi:hypothetical protein
MGELGVLAPESTSTTRSGRLAIGRASGNAEIANAASSTSKPIGASVDNLQFVSEQITKSGKRVIIEDFHYMPEEEKRKLAFDLKAFWDLRVFFIVVGIWAEQNLLTYYNGDLSGRINEIDVQWTDDELNQVIMKGQEALGIIIEPRIKSEMIADASQNVGLLQRIAEKFCIHSGVFETVNETLGRTLASQEALNKCRAEICSEEASRYRQFGDALSRGFKTNEESELKVYQNIARAAVEASDGELRNGLHYDTLFDRVSALNSRVRRSDFTAALQRLNRLQQDRKVSPLVLSYNEKTRYLHLVDRELLFYRRYGNPVWPWNEQETHQDVPV